MSNDNSLVRAKLGDSFHDFHDLEHHVVMYHDTNTVVTLVAMVVCGTAYGVATNTFLADFIIALHG